jgi:radical SAM superfamily enzyme YgiQ (UPF0313 family)
MDEMRRIHQGLPSGWRGDSRHVHPGPAGGDANETIENTINFAKELDVFSLQVSLAAPYPGTELYEMAKQNGWFVKKDKTDLVKATVFSKARWNIRN